MISSRSVSVWKNLCKYVNIKDCIRTERFLIPEIEKRMLKANKIISIKKYSVYFLLLLTLIFSAGVYAAQDNESPSELLENAQVEEVHLDVKDTDTSFIEKMKDLLNDDGSEDNNDDSLDNNEEEFKLFDSILKDDISEKDNFAQKILKSKIRRTDIPSFLLKEDLTFKYAKGPVSQLQFFSGYRGTLNANFNPHSYSTNYENNTLQTGFYGKFRNPNYNFKVMFKPLPVHGIDYYEGFLGDLYVMNTKIPHHQIVAGYSRVQNGIEGSVSSFILPFANRSQIARNFGNSRSLNLKLVGNYEYLDYSMSYGSSGRYITSGFPGTEFSGQFSIKPFGSQDGKFGKLTLGSGVNVGHYGGNYSVGNIYAAYKHKKFWSTAEAAIADGYNGSKGASSNKASGYAVTAGWKFNPHLQLIARVDQFDPDRDKLHNNRREYTAGINWFIRGQALKLILNFVYCDNKAEKDSYRIMLGTQIML